MIGNKCDTARVGWRGRIQLSRKLREKAGVEEGDLVLICVQKIQVPPINEVEEEQGLEIGEALRLAQTITRGGGREE